MDLATVIALIEASKSLVDLGKAIATAIREAQTCPEVKRALIYLDVVQAAVNGLGLERQYILTDVRCCDVSNAEQVNALWERLDRYLQEDNIRRHLVVAIDGLTACQEPIKQAANSGWWWRKRNKAAAVKSFSKTLELLEKTLRDLVFNFYPGYSGFGVLTLGPIYKELSEIRQNEKFGRFRTAEIQAYNQKLGELASKAVRHSSHEQWFKTTGKVEALITELQLAFDVKVAETFPGNAFITGL